MRRSWVLSVAMGATLALSGCSGLLPKPAPPPELYRLTPLHESADGPKVAAQLLVEPPLAPAAIDSARIVLTRGPTSIDYFADAAWTDRAPLMLQSLVVESLENAGRIEAVARDTLELRADALLMPDLRRFEAEYSGAADAPTVRIEFGCRLVKMPERKIIAIRTFSATAPAARNEVPAVVDAFNQAFHDAMRQMAPWVAASLGTGGR